MRELIFTVSTILIVAAIILVFKHKGNRFWGLELEKKWVFILILSELILLLLGVFDYYISIDPDVANSLGWHNLISYYRGSLPLAGLMNIYDFPLKSTILTGALMFAGALFSDYLILRLAAIIKVLVKK